MEKKKPVIKETHELTTRRLPGTDIVGYLSRIDIGSDGYRKGLLIQAAERSREENVDCIFLVGGLVGKREVAAQILKIREEEKAAYNKKRAELVDLAAQKAKFIFRINEEKKELEKKKFGGKLAEIEIKIEDLKDTLKEMKPRSPALILEEFVEQLAKELAEDLPRFQKNDGKQIKVYIVTSPAYDGLVGHRVALRLVELRKKERDVLYFGQTRAFVKLKKSDKGVVLLTPKKDVWRARYYSTYPDRLVEDDLKRGSKMPPEMYVVGCFGSSINRGKGSNKYQRITLPVLHKLEDTTTGENMVGMRIVKYHHGDGPNQVMTFDFKHMLMDERSMITLPPNCSKIQAKIIEDLKVHGSRHIGQFEDDLDIPREALEKALNGLVNRSRAKAGLVFNESSTQYSFNLNWLQKMLRFNWPEKNSGWQKNTVVGFSCPHAGSVHTAEKFILGELPDIIVEEDADVLFDAGDTIEGLKHFLVNRKEVVPGFNYTKQEKLAAYLFSAVMLKAFDKRLAKALKDMDVKKISPAEAEELAMKLLVTFIYICGNHDDWEEELGLDTLALFDEKMRKLVVDGIDRILRERGLPALSLPTLNGLADKKVLAFTEDDVYTFSSGITVGAIHYCAGRTETNSIWPQRALKQFRVHDKIVGNFHVEEEIEEYDAELGLRAADMLPTLKSKSDFETMKGKIVDFGVGVRKMWSYKGRVLITESGLRGKNPLKSLDANEVFRLHCKEIGIDINSKK